MFVISTEPFIVNAEEIVASLLPTTTELGIAYPNPFNASIRIPFTLAQGGRYSVAVYDVLGRKIKTVAAGNIRPGYHQAIWNGTNENNSPVSSGNYFVRLTTASGTSSVKKVVLMK